MTLSLESRKLQEIARSYSERGYRVVQQPGPEQLPKFLEGTQPDLIAQSEAESVIIEVKIGTDRAATESYQSLADRVRGQPGWRFRLVIVDPRSEGFLPVDDPVLTLSEIEERLAEARRMISQGAADTVLLIGWTVLEALLRLLAQRGNLPLELAPSGLLVRELYSLGVLSQEEFQAIDGISKLRNGIAHGFGTHAGMETVSELNQLAEKLLMELRTSANH